MRRRSALRRTPDSSRTTLDRDRRWPQGGESISNLVVRKLYIVNCRLAYSSAKGSAGVRGAIMGNRSACGRLHALLVPRPSAHPCSEFVSKRLIARKPPRDRMSIRVFDFLLLKHHAASPDAAICSKHQRIGALACGQEGHRVSVFAALGAAIQAQRAFSVRLKDGHETSVVRGTPLTPRGPLSSACRMATARPAPCASAYRGTDRHSCGC